MKYFPPALLAILTLTAHAADAPARTEAEILKSLKLPAGYEATVFAQPPRLGYPTSVSAAIDGTLFVAVDENGSLDRHRNTPEKPRGYVLRLRDTDGDGRADEFLRFAEMESPRGVIWDGPGVGADGKMPGTLYVMYPPKLTAFTDTDGDGKADKQEDILTGLGFDLDFRGADHTTNGARLAIDGFIYIAVGDYGFTKAVAKDGTTLSMRGGGIVRIRPDGTGFEIVSRGQRNIYDVAVSPTLDLFTRDNTNDGGGWNVRLSHVPPGAHMGYPTLFKNFPEDMIPALADYGGGSPCGALWIDEPGLQNGLYTVEWGANAIMYHPLKPKGAGWEFDPAGPSDPKTPGQQKWLGITRPTDMDVDAAGRIYISSWEGATFNYNGPNAGYVLRVVKGDAPTAPSLHEFKIDSLDGLLNFVGGNRAALRIPAQREFLRRMTANKGKMAPSLISGWLNSLLEGGRKAESQGNEDGAAAAFFTFGELSRAMTDRKPSPAVQMSAKGSGLERKVFAQLLGNRSIADHAESLRILTATLQDAEPRVRAAAITALRRLGKADAAPQILPLVADEDPIISHLAVGALREFKATPTLLAALDSSGEKVKPGALRALYGIYEPAVVDGLIARLRGAKGDARRGLLNALCRLANQDEAYTDPKVWWGTRPDTSGPVYKPIAWSETPKIEAALRTALDASPDDDARWLIQTMYKTKVAFPGLIPLMLAKAGADTAAKLTSIEGLFGQDNTLPPEGLAALSALAADTQLASDFRAKALRLLARASERGAGFDAALTAFAPLATQPGHASVVAAYEDFTRDPKQTKNLGTLEKAAAGTDRARRALAQTILVNLATSALVKGKDKEAAEKAVAKAWAKPETAASLLGVIARTKAKGYAGEVTAHLKDPDNTVAESALFAYQALGLKDTGAPAAQIGAMKYETVFATVQKGGDPALGKDIYLRAGCLACHTLTADEPPKGPILTAVAKIYDRAALTESILKPNAKLAQGFETATFKTKTGEDIQGFITREGGDSLDVRNIAGQTVTLEKGDIATRGHLPTSMMPEGLMNAFTPADLANLLAYLESLKGQ